MERINIEVAWDAGVDSPEQADAGIAKQWREVPAIVGTCWGFNEVAPSAMPRARGKNPVKVY